MFGKKNKKNVKQPEIQQVNPQTVLPKDKSVISMEDVQQVLQGDKKALEEQMERAKELLDENGEVNYKTTVENKKIKLDDSLTLEGQARIRAEAQMKAQEEARKQREAQEALLKRQQEEIALKVQLENERRAQEKAKQEAEEKARMAAIVAKQKEVEELKRKQLLEQQKINLETEDQKIKEAQLDAINEAKKQQQINNTKIKKDKPKKTTSNTKYVLTIILVMFLVAFVLFLPQIRIIANNIITEANSKKIETGRLICSLDKYSDDLDINYTYNFGFKESKLEELTYTLTTRGDISLDSKELNKKNKNCQLLKEAISDIKGIKVTCSQNEGTVIESQVLSLETLNLEEIKSSYSEYGGNYPNYKYQENINDIEKAMIKSGYECERKK